MDIRINSNINDEVIVSIDDMIHLFECKLSFLEKTAQTDTGWDYSNSISETEEKILWLKSQL